MTTIEHHSAAVVDDDRRLVSPFLVGVLVIAAAVRLYRLGDDSLWNNEILSHERATASPRAAYDLLKEGTHPPGYSQGVLRPWLILGDSEWMQRLPSAVFGVVTVALTAVLGARLAGRHAGLIAAAVLAVMPLHLYYSREGRMYALLGLVTIAWVMALVRAHERGTRADWVIYTVFGAACLYTHYYAAFAVLSVVAVTAVWELRVGLSSRTRDWFVATVAIGVLFLPWLPTFVFQYRNDPVNHLPPLSWSGVSRIPTQFFTAFADQSTRDTMVIAGALIVALLLAAAVLWSSRENAADRGFAAVVVVAAVLGTFAIASAASAVKPVIFIRYFAGILPLVAALIGASVVRRRIAGHAAVAVLLTVSLVHAWPTIDETWRPAFGDATDRIEVDDPADTVVLFVGRIPDDFRATGFRYYLDPAYEVIEVVGSVADASFTEAIETLGPDVRRAWVLQYRFVEPVDAPDGFAITTTERHDSLFLSFTYAISLTALDRTAP